MKTARKIFALMLTLTLILGTMVLPSYAATNWPATSGIQTYCLSTGNDTVVYQTITSTAKYGTIYATDLVTIKGYDSSSDRFKVNYPISGGTKTGYVKRTAITSGKVNSASGTFTATAKITTYRRASTSNTLGSISKGDKCYKIATSGSYTQVIYPISGGYKMGWIKTSSIPSTSTATTTTTTAASVSNGTYTISTKLSSSMVLDVNGNYTTNNTNVQIYTSNGTTAQAFTVTQVSSGWYKIIGVASGKALDVAGGKKASGVNVQIYEYNGTDAQLWKFVSAGSGYYYIQNKLGYYLDVSGGNKTNGTNVQVYSGNQTDSQKWKLTKTTVNTSGSTSTTSGGSTLPTSIYLQQEGTTTCTLASATMMLRARKYLSGKDYSSITESAVKSTAWAGSNGLIHSWTYSDITVAHTSVSGISASSLKSLLDKHPEGIVLYCGNYPHAVFLTRYSGDTFYCADPLDGYSGKELKLASSKLGAVYGSQADVLKKVTAYWYVSKY